MLKQTIWPSNHKCIQHKTYFNEFVANVLRDNIGIVIFDLWGHEGCLRPKTTLGGQEWHEGVDLLKKVFNKIFSTTSDKKDTATSEVTVAVAAAAAGSNNRFVFKLLLMYAVCCCCCAVVNNNSLIKFGTLIIYLSWFLVHIMIKSVLFLIQISDF